MKFPLAVSILLGIATGVAFSADRPPVFRQLLVDSTGFRYDLEIDEVTRTFVKRVMKDETPGDVVACGKLAATDIAELRKLSETPGEPAVREATRLAAKRIEEEGDRTFRLDINEARKNGSYRVQVNGEGYYTITDGSNGGKPTVERGKICREPFEKIRRWAREGHKLLKTPCVSTNDPLPYFELLLESGSTKSRSLCHRLYKDLPEDWKKFWTRVTSLVAKDGQRNN